MISPIPNCSTQRLVTVDDSNWEPDGVMLQVRFCEGGRPYRVTGMPAATLPFMQFSIHHRSRSNFWIEFAIKGSRYRKFYSRCWATIVRSRPGSGGLLSSCSVPCNRWGMIVCGSGERMETLKTLQKQELLAPVEHAVTALFVVRKAGEKQC